MSERMDIYTKSILRGIYKSSKADANGLRLVSLQL